MIVRASYHGRSKLPRRAVVGDAEMLSTLRAAGVSPSREGAVSLIEMGLLFEAACEQRLAELGEKLGRLVSAEEGYTLLPWPVEPEMVN